MLALCVVERDLVLVAPHGVLRDVGGDQRQVLLRELRLRVARQVLALRGEADTERRPWLPGHPGEDVRILLEFEARRAVALFDLVRGRILYAIVGDRCNRNED